MVCPSFLCGLSFCDLFKLLLFIMTSGISSIFFSVAAESYSVQFKLKAFMNKVS